MILLYGVTMLVLGILRILTGLRARSLETRYTSAAVAADQAVKELSVKPGNGAKLDVMSMARRQYELGRLVQRRDALETKYVTWEGRKDRYRHWMKWILTWQGRFVPYALGAVDLAVVVSTLLTFGGLNPDASRELTQAIRTSLQR